MVKGITTSGVEARDGLGHARITNDSNPVHESFLEEADVASDLSGYNAVRGIAIDPDLYPRANDRWVDAKALVSFLAARTNKRLRAFTNKWQPMLPPGADAPDGEQLCIAADMRRILQAIVWMRGLVLDDGTGPFDVGRAMLIAQGVRLVDGPRQGIEFDAVLESGQLASYLVASSEAARRDAVRVSGVGDPERPPASLRPLPGEAVTRRPSGGFSNIRTLTVGKIKDELGRPPLIGADLLEKHGTDETLHLLSFRSTCDAYLPLSPENARGLFIESMLDTLMAGIRTRRGQGHAIQLAPDVLSGLSFVMADVLDDSIASFCRGCGDPMIIPRRGGIPKKYCSTPCRQQFLKARQCWEKVMKDGLDEGLAAESIGISRKSVNEIVGRNTDYFSRLKEEITAKQHGSG